MCVKWCNLMNINNLHTSQITIELEFYDNKTYLISNTTFIIYPNLTKSDNKWIKLDKIIIHIDLVMYSNIVKIMYLLISYYIVVLQLIIKL